MVKLVDGLASLRSEFDRVNPGRDRSSDGWIGDARHAATVSDHNPDEFGAVHAIDVDASGVPMAEIVAFVVARCRAGTERRLRYVIYRRTIWSAAWGWAARAYHGTNPHIKHAHFSAPAGQTPAGSWGISDRFGPNADKPTESTHVKVTPEGEHATGTRRLELQQPVMSGPDVEYVQRWIGDRCGPADGDYGPASKAGVMWYQGMRGLAADGIVGPTTWRHLGVRWRGDTS